MPEKAPEIQPQLYWTKVGELHESRYPSGQRPEEFDMTSAEADGYVLSALAVFPEGAQRVREMMSGVDDEDGEAKDYLLKPLREAIANIFANKYTFLQGEDCQRDRELLEKDPDDPDLVSALAQKLLSQKHFTEARSLIFDARGGQETLRWPDDERMCILAARIFYKEDNARAIGGVLLDETGAPKFPESEEASRLLLKYKMESRGGGNGVRPEVKHGDEADELVYIDARRLVAFTERLLGDGNDGAIRTFFSARNPRLKENLSYRFVRSVLGLLHDRGRRDLLLSVCNGLLELDKNLATVPGFMGFYTRGLNNDRQYEKSVQLLGRETPSGTVAKFPVDVHCVKNLAYALIALHRNTEASSVIDAAIVKGLPKAEFYHLQRMISGKPKDGVDIRRGAEPRV